jgi:hypothetical protein
VHDALTALPDDDQGRLGVTADWKSGPHQLTYRQAEHTSRIITRTPSKAGPDGAPTPDLQRLCDQLREASIPAQFKDASASLAADWADVEARARAVPAVAAGTGADELARRITACSSACDPAAALVPVLEAMAADGIGVGDILADAGFSYRREDTWAGRCATSANS